MGHIPIGANAPSHKAGRGHMSQFSIPSQVGTLFGLPASLVAEWTAQVSIPSQVGTLFGPRVFNLG